MVQLVQDESGREDAPRTDQSVAGKVLAALLAASALCACTDVSHPEAKLYRVCKTNGDLWTDDRGNYWFGLNLKDPSVDLMEPVARGADLDRICPR